MTNSKKRMQDIYATARSFGSQVKSNVEGAWAAAVVGAGQASEWFAQTDWIRSINEDFSNAITKAMDHAYKIGEIDPNTGLEMTANNHRILDGGHTISESFTRALDVNEAQGGSAIDGFVEWGKAYVSDLSSSAGMPIPYGEQIYAFLRNTLNIDEASARDLVTVNGQEAIEALLAGTISAVALIFSWREQDKDAFSKSLGAIGVSALFAANPASALVAVVGLALGYNKQLVSKEGLKRGAFINAVGLGVSVLIPGPVLLGLVPAIVLSVYLEKRLSKDVPVEEEIRAWIAYARSPEFRAFLEKNASAIREWVDRVPEASKAA